ncbi:ATP-binding protein [Nonomuraea sp. NPDC001636]|uniref:ATP-binding protein n=1 Tax=Nonomuraea sp. NPDC001636 TaxID=3154391 RepID=UPI003330D1F5
MVARLLSTPAVVGRDSELQALTDALAGTPSLILVEGEAGIGKSRLLREYLATADQRVLVAACPPFLEPPPLEPLEEAAQAVICSRAMLGGGRVPGLQRLHHPGVLGAHRGCIGLV